MIRETIEEELSLDVVTQRLKEYLGDFELRDANFKELFGAFEAFIGLDDSNRKIFLGGIEAFVCAECGQPSCLCGYSDE